MTFLAAVPAFALFLCSSDERTPLLLEVACDGILNDELLEEFDPQPNLLPVVACPLVKAHLHAKRLQTLERRVRQLLHALVNLRHDQINTVPCVRERHGPSCHQMTVVPEALEALVHALGRLHLELREILTHRFSLRFRALKNHCEHNVQRLL